MVVGTYSLKGGDGGASYTSNVNIIKAAFEYSANPSRCTDNGTSFYCSVFGLYANAYDNGNVDAYDASYYYTVYDAGSSVCYDEGD